MITVPVWTLDINKISALLKQNDIKTVSTIFLLAELQIIIKKNCVLSA